MQQTKQIYEEVNKEKVVSEIAVRLYAKNQKTFIKNLAKSTKLIKDRWGNDLILSVSDGEKVTEKTFSAKDKFAFLDIDSTVILSTANKEDTTLLKDKMFKRLVRNAKAFY